jgi:hypothetical protein
MAQLRPPFFFRIYSPNGQGIVYRADRDNGDSFMCTGSRQIGQDGSQIIWEVGGYADAMPRESMHSIMGTPKPMTKAQTTAFVTRNGLGAKYNSMSLYTDGMGYWFADKSRSRSGSRSGSGSNSNKSKRRGRSGSKGAAKRSSSKGKRKNSKSASRY